MQFLQLFRKYIDYHSKSILYYDQRCPVTIKAYRNKYALIVTYLFDSKRVRIKAKSFNSIVVKDLLNWSNIKYSHNYSVRIVEICKQVLDFGVTEGHIDSHNLPLLRLKRAPPNPLIYLSPRELTSLENYTPADSTKQKARDLFILQCYTGLAYVDLISINESDIIFFKARYYILKERKKTKKDSYIPYDEKSRIILEKYKFKMKILSNPKYNKALKEIAIDLQITKHLTTHVGRKTFAMINLNWRGHSMEATSRMMGITARTAENHYAKVGIDLISREQDRLGFENN